MQPSAVRTGCALAGLCAAPLVIAQAHAETKSALASHDELNNGEDFTRPVGRFDLREKYQRLPDQKSKGLEPEEWVTTLRIDATTNIGSSWKLYGRADLPLVYSNDVTNRFNRDGQANFGQGDLLTESAIIPPNLTERLGYRLGLRVYWPTAASKQAGKVTYQAGPLVGVRYDLPEITAGSFFYGEVRYNYGMGKRNGEEADTRQLFIQPKFNVSLPDRWFVTTFASESIEIDHADKNKLFLPFDVMVGKKFANRFVASLEYSRELHHSQGFEPYDWQLEARVGYYF